MPSGGRLNVRAYNVDLFEDDVRGQERLRAGEFVVLEVSDTGCGMSPETLQRIYDPFFTTKEVGKGTGLGLSMVYGFVKESRGMIDVSSEVGKGSVFKIFLPRTGAPATTNVVSELKSAVVRAGATILVVDDDLAVRKTVVAQLGSFGYKIIEAGAPAEALAILDRNEPFDLLFTDIVMPGGLSGIDLARMARERRADLKVLLTSGFPDLKRQHGADEKNADVILSKPYRRSELQQAIGDMLAGV
jgi:CheY-like chemotaxis protein